MRKWTKLSTARQCHKSQRATQRWACNLGLLHCLAATASATYRAIFFLLQRMASARVMKSKDAVEDISVGMPDGFLVKKVRRVHLLIDLSRQVLTLSPAGINGCLG